MSTTTKKKKAKKKITAPVRKKTTVKAVTKPLKKGTKVKEKTIKLSSKLTLVMRRAVTVPKGKASDKPYDSIKIHTVNTEGTVTARRSIPIKDLGKVVKALAKLGDISI